VARAEGEAEEEDGGQRAQHGAKRDQQDRTRRNLGARVVGPEQRAAVACELVQRLSSQLVGQVRLVQLAFAAHEGHRLAGERAVQRRHSAAVVGGVESVQPREVARELLGHTLRLERRALVAAEIGGDQQKRKDRERIARLRGTRSVGTQRPRAAAQVRDCRRHRARAAGRCGGGVKDQRAPLSALRRRARRQAGPTVRHGASDWEDAERVLVVQDGGAHPRRRRLHVCRRAEGAVRLRQLSERLQLVPQRGHGVRRRGLHLQHDRDGTHADEPRVERDEVVVVPGADLARAEAADRKRVEHERL